MNFSVLMSIYKNESPIFFSRAMESIWDEQALKPAEIVLVLDGPLPSELHTVVSRWKEKLPDVLKVIRLSRNMGLGDALNIGLKECAYDIVARMDGDDISLPDRFLKQVDFLRKHKDIAVVGSWVSEFTSDENEVVSTRRLPENHEKLFVFAKRRNPMNHPSVVFRKEAVMQAGGYQKMMWLEDYYLWVRMMSLGMRFVNIQEPLVSMRAGFPQLERRSGIKYAFSEYALQRELLKLNFINHVDFMTAFFSRVCVRLLPKVILGRIYRLLRSR